ncbi:cell wall metabolism sensor histidine kinase WalK [Arthrobacter sp. SX1312]|uniref:sensor histidine kinase n=1 Tax=Arthrobacter sp. SX1312 TaxID=2058896 RepID=UPI0021572361|nr:ATP-binding protein [Arthrobacter sp. SX1312]
MTTEKTRPLPAMPARGHLVRRPPPPRYTPTAQDGGRLDRIGRVFSRATRRWSVRSRVLSALLALSALGLLFAGTTAYGLQRATLNADIDNSLERSFGEFETLLATGIDPATRSPFVTAETLVYLVMQRTLPAPNEGMMGIRDSDAVLLANDAVSLRLEDDPELVAAAADRSSADDVAITTIDTARATYRAIVVPVMLSEDTEPTTFVLAYDIDAERAELNRTYTTFALISLGALLLIGAVGWLLIGNLLHPVRRLRETAQTINDSDLSQRIVVTGNDDLSDLTRTFNAMLDRLEKSFTSQRQLLDDVGHELRTPITIIQGHLELQDPTDREDVDAVRAVALDELERMRLLVDDLVTLAGSARPDFVRPKPTSVDRLTDDILDKARGLGDRRWIIDSRAEGEVPLDDRRVTQALLQLAANAVKFSTDGSTIAVGSRLDGDRLSLWVRDEGIGISAADQQRIFGRFERGSDGRRAEGAGLGLSIVEAIAQAHGGGVSVLSAPGRGSTFTLELPTAARRNPADAVSREHRGPATKEEP